MATAETTHDSHDSHDSHGEHGHGLAHVASLKVLFTVFGILMALTLITVLATKVDLGGTMNLIVAMLIATVKATLVCLYFMHLRYDKPLHAVAFLSALLFAILFVGLTLMDQAQYLHSIAWDPNALPEL